MVPLGHLGHKESDGPLFSDQGLMFLFIVVKCFKLKIRVLCTLHGPRRSVRTHLILLVYFVSRL